MNTVVMPDTQLAVERPAKGLLGLAERGMVPDQWLRLGIRRRCRERLDEEYAGGLAAQAARFNSLIGTLRRSPVAIHTDAANAQHYELPAAFFQQCLGARLKYSGCYYPTGHESLDQAESAMLALYAERAQLDNRQRILELGCGWGSLTLWMAERYPDARITAVSNSASQRGYIEQQCQERSLTNVQVITQDVNTLTLAPAHFDRCVSVEMFEHMRNYATLLSRIAQWLKPDGKLFVHIFAHRTLMYPFETHGESNWMGRHFFTGGLMPSIDSLLWFQDSLSIEERWLVDGTHYQRTANHWLHNQDVHRAEVMSVLRSAYRDAAELWFQRWRMFWMSCAELFGYDHGQQWLVAHYRFAHRAGEGWVREGRPC